MTPGKRRKIAKVLSLVVGVTGLAVMIGWIADIRFLKSISPAWISMKFDTAIAFCLSSVTVYFIARSREGAFDQAQVVLSITSLVTFLLMGVVFFSTLLGVHTGVEDLFIRETNISAKTVIPGRPSLPTAGNFLLVASVGILATLGYNKLSSGLKIIGSLVGVIGAAAIAGYVMHVPLLYYFLPGVNSAMAAHTAALFVLLGGGLLCLSD